MYKTRILSVVALFFLFAAIFCLTAIARTDALSVIVRGRIIDQNKAVVVGASVVAADTRGKPAVMASSDSNGEFSFSLAPSDYVLEVKASGFNSLTKNLHVSPEQTGSIEINLEIAPATATVTVSDGGDYTTATVFSATKTPTALRDLPQSISITGKQQISDQLFSSIADVARYQPGITSHQGENNRDQLIIRGQNSSADFYVNGVRDDVQYYRDLYNLERVETLRGPNALAFGRGGGGGVVNRVTKEAEFSPLYEFTLQGGAFGNRRGTFDINKPINKKIALRVNGVGEVSDSFRDFVDLRRFGFNPTATISPDSNTRITLSYDFFRDRRTADRGISSFNGRPLDIPISTFFGNPSNSKVRADVNLFNAGFERVFGSFIVRNRTMYGDYDRFYQNYVPGVSNGESSSSCVSQVGTVCISAYNNATKRRNLFNQTDFIYNLVAGGTKHMLLGGFEFGRQHSNNFRNTGYFNNSTTQTTITVPIDDPIVSAPTAFRQSATDADNRTRLNLGAAYVQDQIELSRFVQIVAGLRLDYFDLKFHNNRTNVAVRDFSRIDRLVSPRIGVVIKPVTNLSLYGNYSVSYLPSSGDQYSSLAANTETLKPEKFQNYEVGVKWDILRNLSFTSAAYRLDRTNTRAVDPQNPTLFVPTGGSRTNGFEAGLNGNITRSWSVTGGYAYQDAFITKTTSTAPAGTQIAQVPRHSFSVWNKYQFTRRLGAGLGLIRRSDMFASLNNNKSTPPLRSVVLPAYIRVDGAVFYSFNENWRLQANVENIFDTRYYQNADNNTNISPGSPRAAKIALVARF